MRIYIWVHTWHGRSAADRAGVIRSLDASDAAGKYEVECQPEGVGRNDFYMDTLRKICALDVDYMLRIEDDAIVNAHLLHNAAAWSAPQHPRFGAGWLSVTSELLADRAHIGSLGGFHTREYPECYFAGGVLMKLSTLRAVLSDIEKRLRQNGETARFAPGCALSRAVWENGLRVFFHEPSIVAIDATVRPYHGVARPERFWRQPFSSTWKAH